MPALPEISKKWWEKECPAGINGDKLSKALSAAEKALADADKKNTPQSIDDCLDSLGSVGSAAETVIKKECDKKKHKELISLLEGYEKVIKQEITRLQEAKAELAEAAEKEKEKEACKDGEGDEDEDERGKLFQPDYLDRMIKLLRSGNELSFSFGLNKQEPKDSCLLLCRKREPDRLLKLLKSKTEFSKRLMTFGKAAADGKTLQFILSEKAKEPSQICKLTKEYLKKNDLKFRKLKVVCGSEVFEEDMPDADGEGGDLNQQIERLQGLVAAWGAALNDVSAQIEKLRAKLKTHEEPMLRTVGDGLGEVVSQFPDLDLSRLIAAAQANDRAAYDQTLSQTAKEIDQMHEILTKGPLLSTIDANPIEKTTVHSTINSVLSRITSELGIKA